MTLNILASLFDYFNCDRFNVNMMTTWDYLKSLNFKLIDQLSGQESPHTLQYGIEKIAEYIECAGKNFLLRIITQEY